MPEDSINTLIGTFSAVQTNFADGADEVTVTQCICIDTSNNRIGINTLTPDYAIDISTVGTNATSSCIRTPRLIISDISYLIANNAKNTAGTLTSGELYVENNVLKVKY